MLYWTDIGRGLNVVPFDFEKVSVDCELFKKNTCPFVKKPSTVCSLGFEKMAERGCITIHGKVNKDGK